MKQKIALSILLFYIVVRFCFTTWLDTIFPYSAYAFEVLLVFIVIVIYKKEFLKLWYLPKKILLIAGIAGVAGFCVYKLTGPLKILIPFDFDGSNVWFFLLIVAPLLEELIFRFLAWKPLEKWGLKIAWIVTTLLFSYSHLHAMWFVSPDIMGFIYYQTAYTLVLGLVCGYSVYKYRSLLGATLIHVLFNLGFFLAVVI